MNYEVDLNGFFRETEEEKKEKRKYKRTPKKIRKIIQNALEQVGGEIPDDPWHIRMLTAKIVHEHRMWISTYTVYKYLKKAQCIKLRNGWFILERKTRK